MHTIYCSNCGSDIRVSPIPTNCPNCNYHLQAEKQSTEHTNVTELQSDMEKTSHSSTKSRNKMIFYVTPLLIVAALLLGLFSPKTSGDAANDFPIAMSKSQVVSFLSAANDEEIAETDIEFSDVQAKRVEEENKNTPGTYEVSGKFTHDEKTYTFTHEVLLYNGIYYFQSMPEYDEK